MPERRKTEIVTGLHQPARQPELYPILLAYRNSLSKSKKVTKSRSEENVDIALLSRSSSVSYSVVESFRICYGLE